MGFTACLWQKNVETQVARINCLFWKVVFFSGYRSLCCQQRGTVTDCPPCSGSCPCPLPFLSFLSTIILLQLLSLFPLLLSTPSHQFLSISASSLHPLGPTTPLPGSPPLSYSSPICISASLIFPTPQCLGTSWVSIVDLPALISSACCHSGLGIQEEQLQGNLCSVSVALW